MFKIFRRKKFEKLLIELETDKGFHIEKVTIKVTRTTITRLIGGGTEVKNSDYPYWFPFAGVIFCALSLVSLFLLVTGAFQLANGKFVFNAWLSLCVAASGAFLGGPAAAKGTLPIPSQWGEHPIKFFIAGGGAIFVIVLLLSSALNR